MERRGSQIHVSPAGIYALLNAFPAVSGKSVKPFTGRFAGAFIQYRIRKTRMVGFVPATRFEGAPNLELRFPPLSRTVRVVFDLLEEDDEEPNVARLAGVVQDDPLASLAVLRRINSSFPGLHRRVTSIKKAVHLLGFLDVSNIVLTEGMLRLRGVVKSEEQVRVFEMLAQMSVGTAYLARYFARAFHLSHPETAYSAGILHAIGRFILLYNKPNDYEALWWTDERGLAPGIASERAIFGIDHMSLAEVACDHWHLPAPVVRIVGNYQTPHTIDEPSIYQLCFCVRAASDTAQQLFIRHAANDLPFDPPESLFLLCERMAVAPDPLIRLVKEHRVALSLRLAEIISG